MSNRWTVRNIDAAALDLLRKVHEQRGVAMGVLLTRAIRVWHASLTEMHDDGGPQITPIISCDLAYPTSLSDLLRQFSPGT